MSVFLNNMRKTDKRPGLRGSMMKKSRRQRDFRRPYLRRSMRMQEQILLTDPLTGGYNRNGFLKRSMRCITEKPELPYSVVCMNICEFRRINEMWGEDAGNATLRFVYRILKAHAGEWEPVCRSSMDHFLMLVHDGDPQETEQRIGHAIGQMNDEIQKVFGKYTLEFSIGVCRISDGSVIQAISNATYIRKEKHRKNTCAFFGDETRKKIQEEKELNEQFEESIRRNDFQIYLQPKVPVQSGEPCQAEALVRWLHPVYGMLQTERFISLFEKNGKICALDLYIFEGVCRLIAGWISEKRPVSKISVNISRVHLKNEGADIWKQYRDIKERYGIPDGIVEIELTENALLDMNQIGFVKEILDHFRSCGFLVALDDFGFAYSSLSLLKEFEIDTIKLDRSFFVNENDKSRRIVRSMIGLAHSLSIRVVAEGIEDERQVASLREMDCDFIQGYVYSRPVAVETFESWRDAYEEMR